MRSLVLPRLAAVLWAVVGLAAASAALTVHPYGVHSRSRHFPSPRFDLGVSEFFVNEAEVTVAGTGGTLCDDSVDSALAATALANKLALVKYWDCSIEEKIRNCQDAGCLGVVAVTNSAVPGRTAFGFFDLSSKDDLLVPYVEVSQDHGEELLEAVGSGLSVRITLLPGEKNEWKDAFDSSWFKICFQGFHALVSIIAAFMCAFRLQKWMDPERTRALQFQRVPIVCLSLELLGNLVRAVVFIVDPVMSKQVVFYPLAQFLLSITAPWAYASTILIIFLWKEALHTTSSAYLGEQLAFIDSHRIVFAVVTFLLVAADIVLEACIGFYVGDAQALFDALAAYYLVNNVIISAWMIVTGMRVINFYKTDERTRMTRLRSSMQQEHAAVEMARRDGIMDHDDDDDGDKATATEDVVIDENVAIDNREDPRIGGPTVDPRRASAIHEATMEKVTRMSNRLVVSAVGMVVLAVLLALFFGHSVNGHPTFFVVTWWFIHSALALTSYAQILTF